MKEKTLSGSELKLIAMIAMTADHLASVIWPGYGRAWWLLLIHVFGRLAAPIFWFFVAEGFHYTRNRRKYAGRLFILAVISHFAYNFAFGIPFVPFQTSVFNQTSVIWPLFWGVVVLSVLETDWKQWQKTLLVLAVCAITFCADWSCIAVLAIVQVGENRGNFKRQMTGMMFCVAMYAVVYMLFIDPVYGAIQMCTALTIPLLSRYHGEKGGGNKWLFYVYYPLHLIICGVIRVALHGNVGVIIGG